MNKVIASVVGAPPRSAEPRRCVVLVPFSTHIVPACERGLIELALCRRGYEVWRAGGYSAIDLGRAEIVTKALAAGFEETFWIDSDIDFNPDSVDRLRAYNLPITCGIYPRKGSRAIAAHTLPGTTQFGMGKGTGLVKILYAGTGFLHVRREVYTAIREKLKLPMCNAQFGRPMVPFFQPMIVRDERGAGGGEQGAGSVGERAGVPALAGNCKEKPAKAGTPTDEPAKAGTSTNEGSHWYLGEDYSFCERARQCGYKIMADTSIRLWHIGEYAYGWEDAGLEKVRHDSFLFMIDDGKKQ